MKKCRRNSHAVLYIGLGGSKVNIVGTVPRTVKPCHINPRCKVNPSMRSIGHMFDSHILHVITELCYAEPFQKKRTQSVLMSKASQTVEHVWLGQQMSAARNGLLDLAEKVSLST